jgi:hypothetical protein
MTTACIEWQGHKTPGGYGLVRFRGRNTTAHRRILIQTYGEIPTGLLVLHHCDNPPCIEPTHLFLGTPRDNMLDMIRKGRDDLKHPHPKERNPGVLNPRIGVLNGRSRLTETEVREIRTLATNGASYPTLAANYGMSHSAISDIVNRKRWRHV